MKKIIFVLVTCMLFLNVAQAVVVWSDNMEYADQTAAGAVWPKNPTDPFGVAPAGLSALSLTTAKNHTSGGSKSLSSAGIQQFSEHYFGATSTTTIATGTVEVWIYDPLTTTSGTNIFGVAEVVRGSGYSLFGVVGPISSTNYSYRTDQSGGYVNTGIARTQGWHQILFTFGASDSTGIGGSIYFDGQFIANDNTMHKGIWALEFGNKWSSASNETFYWDDVKLYSQIIPEPTTMILLSFGSMLLSFRKRA